MLFLAEIKEKLLYLIFKKMQLQLRSNNTTIVKWSLSDYGKMEIGSLAVESQLLSANI